MKQDLRGIYQVNDNIALVLAAPLGCDLTHVHNSFWVVCIHVEDWSVDDTSDVCAVRRRSREARVSGETNLGEKSQIK